MTDIKMQALKAANRPDPWRVTTVFGRRVRVLWWHDVVAGIAVAALAVAVLTVGLAIL